MLHLYYHDRAIAVCEKPRGLLSEGESADALPRLLADALAVDGVAPRIYPVHRLDRQTEGIMVFALTPSAAASLSAQIAAHEFEKEYLAEVHGSPVPEEGRMDDLLFFDRARNRSYAVSRMRKGVKEAALRYRVLSSADGISRVAIRLETGRTHQIRVQFASRRMPLVGDFPYGAPKSARPLALRACYLRFSHPSTGDSMAFGESNWD